MHLLVRHKVADFIRWRETFESHKEAQREAGMELERLWRDLDDPDDVVLLFEVEDLDKAREFVHSSDIPDAYNGVEVVDEPDIYFLE